MIDRLQRDAVILIDNVIQMAYFMRGGATYGEIMNMTPGERDRVSTFLDRRLEAEKKNPNPVY